MSSPNPPHAAKVEVWISGAWVDISADVYPQRDKITVTRGRSGESGRIAPGSATLTLDNRSKKYSPRNPTGIYYGQFKRNCPLRISVGADVRFVGEIAVARPRADQSGIDLYTEVQAAGGLRRLGQGASPVKSIPAVYYPSTSPRAYWPLDDGPLTVAGATTTPTTATTLNHMGPTTPGWGSGTLAPWLPDGLEGRVRDGASDDSRFVTYLATSAACTRWELEWLVNGRVDYTVTVSNDVTLGGTAAWTLSMSPSVNSITVTGPAGTAGDGTPISYAHDGLFHHMRWTLIENSIGDATYYLAIDGVTVHSRNYTGASILIEPLHIDLVLDQSGTNDATGVTIGHLAYYFNATAPSVTTAVQAARGYPGELAGTRIARLCTENAITLTTVGSASTTHPCGPQYTETLLDILSESAEVDGGLLYETVSSLGLTYRTRSSIYNEAVSLALTYTTNHHLGKALDPPEDDQLVRNDVTITRRLGGTSNYARTTGALGSAAPPAGVGRYDDSATINCLEQWQAADHAGWRVHLGTWDEARYPTITLDMSTLPLAKRTDALTVTIGSRITIDTPPAWLPPDQIDLLVVGVRETLTRFEWEIVFVCVPFGPWRVAVMESLTQGRASSDGSTLNGAHSSSTTSLSVATPSGPLWTTTAGEFPFDIRVAGERMTVTNITGGASPQTFTVTRSVNTVVKAQLTGAIVELWQPAYAAL